MPIAPPIRTPTHRTVRGDAAPARPDRGVDRVAVRRIARPAVWLGPCVTAVVLVAVVGLSGVRGADYPAHVFRAEHWRRAGGSAWNFGWYGGHAVVTYGVLSPPVVAVLGAFATVAISTVVATTAFATIVHRALPQRIAVVAAYAFAVTATVDVVVGRVAFGVGLAIGLVAVSAWMRGKVGWALLGAFATSLASPVAGSLLALCAAAVAIGAAAPGTPGGVRRARVAMGLSVAGLATFPVAMTSIAFGTEGEFPFRGGHLVMTLCVALLAAVVFDQRDVRIACGLATLAAAALFVVPNAMGGNFVRLPQIVGVPLLLAAVAGRRSAHRAHRTVLWAAATVAVAWGLSPGVVAATAWRGDASVDRGYFDPLIAEVQRRNERGAPGRIEIPFTKNHWEATWVALAVPYARGWERQLDVTRNPELYEPELDASTYREWLDRNAVRWIAVADAPRDHSAVAEVALILAAERRGDDWLRRVWQHPDWVLFEVAPYRPIVGEPAELVRLDVDQVVVAVDRPAVVDIRIAHSRTLAIWPSGCLARAVDGSVRATMPVAGMYRITSALWDARRSQHCSS